jgi:3-hydroxyacyl-[acyl-carrier-protein] dehydratase
MAIMDIQEILKYLPHRYPFLLVDRVLEIASEKLVAIKNVTCNEPFFTGHFPNRLVMPGVLILEALAQSAGIYAFHSTGTFPDDESLYYFAAIENARFKRVVKPGDQLLLTVELIRRKQNVWKFRGTATVDGELACSAEMTSIKSGVV